jgi:hypothetical protein
VPTVTPDTKVPNFTGSDSHLDAQSFQALGDLSRDSRRRTNSDSFSEGEGQGSAAESECNMLNGRRQNPPNQPQGAIHTLDQVVNILAGASQGIPAMGFC